MIRSLCLTLLLSSQAGVLAAQNAAVVPTTLATVHAGAASPAVTQRVREEVHQMLVRLATSGALGAHPDQIALNIDEPAARSINLGLLVDATSANSARDGLHVLGATPGSVAEKLGVHPGDVVVAVNGASLRDLGADDSGRALAAATLRSSIDTLPDDAALRLDVQRGGNVLALNGPVQSLHLPALRLALGSADAAVTSDPPAATTAGSAQACGRIKLLDLAPRQQHLYGATILQIDGVTPGPHNAPAHRLDAGVHQLLVAERIPTQAMGLGDIATRRNDKPKPLTVNVAANTTIMIAARFNIENATKITDGSYWDPVVWKEIAEPCP